MTAQRLNIFQRLIRYWDELHPYNAAQVFQLRGEADVSRLTETFGATLAALKLGSVSVAGRMFVHEPAAGCPEVQILESEQSLDDFLSRQMNLPFPADGGCPFRPFVVRGEDSHFAGIVYHHWVADSSSIRLLMREWFYRLYDSSLARTAPLPAPQGGFWRYFGPRHGKWDLPLAVLQGISWQSRMKRVRRFERCDFNTLTIGFTRHPLPDGLIDALRIRARAEGVTVNDLFLSAIADLSHRHLKMDVIPKRADLAVGSIVDLRSQSRELADEFGLFLGFNNYVLRPGDLRDPQRRLRAVATQSRQQKINHTAEASMLRFLAGVIGIRMKRGRRDRVMSFYRKRMALAGGVSNVNLNNDWPAKYHPDPLLRYIRVSPTGPMMPFVITPTTLGKTLHFGFTVRQSLIPPPLAEQMAADYSQSLIKIAGA